MRRGTPARVPPQDALPARQMAVLSVKLLRVVSVAILGLRRTEPALSLPKRVPAPHRPTVTISP